MLEFRNVSQMLLAINDHAVATGHTILLDEGQGMGTAFHQGRIGFYCEQCHTQLDDEFIWCCSQVTARGTIPPDLVTFRSPGGRRVIARMMTEGAFALPEPQGVLYPPTRVRFNTTFRADQQVSGDIYDKLIGLDYRAICLSPVGFVPVRKLGRDRFSLVQGSIEDGGENFGLFRCGLQGYLRPTGMLIFMRGGITDPIGCLRMGDPWEIIESLRVTPAASSDPTTQLRTRFEREDVV
jgi:hypothetical protein